ncbi:permease [Luminiphilus syltensis NOR5-1B]|uniref:Permease n=1 Tax=Luminiphilus syltensis NOR5-1B TaxID=565045 RepID=B8KQC8_9GAMM|nr:AI-2E family transporter [Luminiphilus syltensis]EED36984.1 permease [Luminiphilus syltensis NOR5-1B]
MSPTPEFTRMPLVIGAFAIAVLLFYVLHPILMPFVVGGLLGYLGDPVVDRLEARGWSRSGGVAAVFVIFILGLSAILAFLIPMLLSQLDQLVRQIPEIYQWLAGDALPWFQSKMSLSPVKLPNIDWEQELAANWQSLGKLITDTLRRLTTSGIDVATILFNIALIPVVAFYLMRDWDRLMEATLDLIPRPWQENLSLMVAEADDVLGAFLRGQFLVMLAQALMYSVGLLIVGLDVAVVLGTAAGLASIIPYAGAVVGVGSSLAVAWFQFGGEWLPLIWVALVFGVGQTIESWFLTPLLVGDRIGLHPVAVIFALMAGGQVAGFTGVLVALPVAAVLLVFTRHAITHYRASDAYHRD